MLKITLVQGEVVNIGSDIKLQLASKGVYRASILIDAPKNVSITREQTEIFPEPVEVYRTKKNKISIVDNRREYQRTEVMGEKEADIAGKE